MTTHRQTLATLVGGCIPEPTRRTVAPAERLLLSAGESADLLGMSLRKFHQTRPLLPPPVVIGARHVRWRRGDLTAWVESLTAAGERPEPPQLAAGKALKRGNGSDPGSPPAESE